eukprot:tig00021017_g17185.t1
MGKKDKKDKAKKQEKKAKKQEKRQSHVAARSIAADRPGERAARGVQAKKAKSDDKKKKKELKETGEEDIESILAQIIAKENEKKVVTEEVVGPPSSRCNFSFTVHPTVENTVYVYGGEYFDGQKTLFYNELFKYNAEKNEWKLISSPNSPPPRSSHAAAAYRDWIYIFGGEFASMTQTQFYHYKDLWRLHLPTHSWEALPARHGPTARSGHRIAVWKNKLVLFGGFYDTTRDIKYYNDLFLFDLEELRWQKVEEKGGMPWPTPRSGFQMVSNENGVYVFGGYCKQVTDAKGEQAKGIVNTDIWFFNPANLRWERLKRSGFGPSPRSGFSMGFHALKKRAVLFGGVHDEETDEDINSVFYSDMYAYDLDRKRWYPLTLRKAKAAGGQRHRRPRRPKAQAAAGADGEARGEGSGGSGGEGADGEAGGGHGPEKKPWEEYNDDCAWVFESGSEDGGAGPEEASAPPPPQPAAEAPSSASAPEPASRPLPPSTSPSTAPAPTQPAAPAPGASGKPSSKPSTPSASASASPAPKAHAARDEDDPELEEHHEPPPGSVGVANPAAVAVIEQNGPCARYNAQVAIKGNSLWLYGGMFELGDKEITLSDLWRLDLAKLDAWHPVVKDDIAAKVLAWKGEESGAEDGSDDSDDDSDDSDEEEDDDDSGSSEEDEEEAAKAAAAAKKKEEEKERKREALRERLRTEEDERTPRPGETLRDFFARTAEFWARNAYEQTQQTGKSLRRDGFQQAEARWKEVQPVLEELLAAEREAKEEEEEAAAARRGPGGPSRKPGAPHAPGGRR